MMLRKVALLGCLLLLTGGNALAAFYFVPRITFTEEYVDNIYLEPDNQKSDWITTISPGAYLEFRGRTSGVSLDYAPSLVKYREYSQEDTWRHRGHLGLWYDLSRRTRFEAENVSIYTEEPFTEELYSQYDPNARTQRHRYFLNIASTDLHYQFSRENFIDLGYSHELLNNEDAPATQVDGTPAFEDTQRHEPYILLAYWLEPNEWGTETTLRYRKGLYEISDDFDLWTAGIRLIRRFNQHLDGTFRYAYSSMDYNGTEEDYQLHEAGPGMTYLIGENTNLSAEFLFVFRDRAVSQDENELIFVSDIFHRWRFGRNYIDLTASSGYHADTFGAQTIRGFNIFAEGNAAFTYNFSRQTYWDIYGNARYDKYVDVVPERVDNTFRAGTGISHQPFSWATLRLSYSYRQLLSEIYEEEYVENRILLSLTLMPITEQARMRQAAGARRRNQSYRNNLERSDSNRRGGEEENADSSSRTGR